jgi:hypothetical protein
MWQSFFSNLENSVLSHLLIFDYISLLRAWTVIFRFRSTCKPDSLLCTQYMVSGYLFTQGTKKLISLRLGTELWVQYFSVHDVYWMTSSSWSDTEQLLKLH